MKFKKGSVSETVYESLKGLCRIGLLPKSEITAFKKFMKASKVTPKTIKRLKKRFRLTTETLALLLNKKESSIKAWEDGTKKPGKKASYHLLLLEYMGFNALLDQESIFFKNAFSS